MANSKKQNKILRYFTVSIVPDIISAVFILAGAFIYYYAWQIWVLATPLLLIGIAGLIVNYAFKISEQTFTDYFTKKFEGMPKERGVEPEVVYTEYSFEGNTYAKTDKLGAPRSEICVRTVIYFDKQLKVVSGSVNAVTEELTNTVCSFEHARAEVNNTETKIKGSTKKLAVMTITDGSQSISFPVKYNDSEVDQFIERLNKRYAE